MSLSIMLRFPFNGSFPTTFQFGQIPKDEIVKMKFIQWGLKGHNGIDFSLPLGTEVVATDSGKVVQTGKNGDFGICVTLQHTWGTSFYAHLKGTSVLLDQQTKQGQKIRLSGKTGYATGAHLHFGIKPIKADINNGYLGFIDPVPFL